MALLPHRLRLLFLLVIASSLVVMVLIYQLGDGTDVPTKFIPNSDREFHFDIHIASRVGDTSHRDRGKQRSVVKKRIQVDEEDIYIWNSPGELQNRPNPEMTLEPQGKDDTDIFYFDAVPEDNNLKHKHSEVRLKTKMPKQPGRNEPEQGRKFSRTRSATELKAIKGKLSETLSELQKSKSQPMDADPWQGEHSTPNQTPARDTGDQTVRVPANVRSGNVTLVTKSMAEIEREIKEITRKIDKHLSSLRESGEEERQVLAEEWHKLREQQHLLLEEKIRFQKGLGQWMGRQPGENPLHSGRLPPTDPRHWEGLNSTAVETRYPGILFSREYAPQEFVEKVPENAVGGDQVMGARVDNIKDMTAGQAEERFYQLVTMTHVDCGDIRRLGNTEDGGWDVCVAQPYTPRKGCLVYSFGINFDFAFDDALAATFGCEIRAFDPSMNVGDHMHSSQVYFYQLGIGALNTVTPNGWRLETLHSIMNKLGHLNHTIDLLKMDIEFNEWTSLLNMLEDGVLRYVKQLSLEIHTPEVYLIARPSTKEDFVRMYEPLLGLEKAGFRKFHFTYNSLGKYTSSRTGKLRTCCYELYYININFLKF